MEKLLCVLYSLFNDLKSLYFVQVVIPYFRSKLQSIYNKEREALLQASLWDHDAESSADHNFALIQEDISPLLAQSVESEASRITRIKQKIKKFIGACYPWIHATNEGTHQILVTSMELLCHL